MKKLGILLLISVALCGQDQPEASVSFNLGDLIKSARLCGQIEGMIKVLERFGDQYKPALDLAKDQLKDASCQALWSIQDILKEPRPVER